MGDTPPAEPPIPFPGAPSRAPSPDLRGVTATERVGHLFAGKAKCWSKCALPVDVVYSFIEDKDFLDSLKDKQRSYTSAGDDDAVCVHFIRTNESPPREISDPPRNGPNKGFDSDVLENLIECAQRIVNDLRCGKTIYVGCRAGENRSLTLAGIAQAMARAHSVLFVAFDSFISKQDPDYMGGLVRIANELVDVTEEEKQPVPGEFVSTGRILLDRFNDFTEETRLKPRKSARGSQEHAHVDEGGLPHKKPKEDPKEDPKEETKEEETKE